MNDTEECTNMYIAIQKCLSICWIVLGKFHEFHYFVKMNMDLYF